ncbi:MAG: CHAT domain-containing tetratricopeptide repeat protein [Bacteroidota bacterium]
MYFSYMRYILTAFFLLTQLGLSAFQSDTSLIRKQLQSAKTLSEQKDVNKAEAVAVRALQLLKDTTPNSIELQVGLIHILGDCALEKANYTDALEHYEQAQNLLKQTYSRPNPLQVENLNKIGNYYREIKEFEKALDYLYQGLVIAEQVLSSDNLQLANLYNNIGICLNNIGDYDKALEFYREALSIRSIQLSNPHPQIAQSYNNIGLCYLDKAQPEQALDAFREAIDIYSNFYKSAHQDIADVHLNMGNVYFQLQDTRLFTAYNKALEIYQQSLERQHPSIALCYNNLANAYDSQGNFSQSSDLYQRALKIMLFNYGEIHPDVAMSYFNIGISNYLAAKEQAAMAAFQSCFKSLNYQVKAEAVFDKVNDHQILLQLLQTMSDVEIASYDNTQKLDHLIQAFEYYREIDHLFDYLRGRFEAIGSKLLLVDYAHDVYDYAIELAITLYRLSNDDQYLHDAFQFSEKSKGILLLEGLKKAEAEEFSGIPAEKITEIEELELSISELEKRRFLAWQKTGFLDQNLIDSLEHLIFEQKQLLSQKINTLEKDFPQYYELRYATTAIPVEMIQQEIISSDQTILEYFMGNERLHIFVINQDDFQLVSIGIDSAFFHWLDVFNLSIRQFPNVSSDYLSQNLDYYVNSAYELYQYLIQPVEELLKDRLVIIPDGELGLLAFAVLMSEYPNDNTAFKSHAYLIRNHSISYNYSVSLLKEMIERKTKEDLLPYLGLAPEFKKGNKKGLFELKYNDEEVSVVQEMIGGKALFNEEATKANFLSQQAAYRIVHLATHGKANTTAGDFSYLAFSETSEVKDDDALLFVKEIYNLSTNVEMVMLSACETNVGELLKGEGIASIARSFSYAGAQSLITTQWSVDDRATFGMVQLFFNKIKKGVPKDRAMQNAMLDFLEESGKAKAHPYYWASFVPIGNMEKIGFIDYSALLIWGLPIFIIIALYFIRNKRKTKQ